MITSYGYDGTMSEAGWAVLAPLLGSRERFAGASDFAVSIGGVGSRAITVAAGTACGHGVADVNSAAINLNATAVASGTRWDTVVIRRTWSTNSTTVAINTGGATQTPVVLNTSPGIVDDQPIALILVSSASTTVQSVVDLRPYGDGVRAYATSAALPTTNTSAGTLAVVPSSVHGGDLYVYNGTSWLSTTAPIWRTLTLNSGFTTYDVTPQYARVGALGILRGTVKRSTGAAFADGSSYDLATLPDGFRPSAISNHPLSMSIADSNHIGRGVVFTTGIVRVHPDGSPDWVSIDCVYPIG